jgi:hypothetical protein
VFQVLPKYCKAAPHLTNIQFQPIP